MPEIAEVETVRRTLLQKIINHKIIDINVICDKIIESDLTSFKNNIINQEFIDIKRRGKWLIFELNDYYLLSHLRMEGKYFLKQHNEAIDKHEHIVFKLDRGIDLRYHDTRKFGKMILCKKEELYNLKPIKKQGIEPNDDKLTIQYLKDKLKNKNLPIKSILLDQTIISGLGNIYANEVLYDAKINPLKKGKDLNEKELKEIINSTNKIIKRAIELGGTTIKSYTSSLGVTGRFQQELKVHNKENSSCNTCNTNIKRIKIGGRSTYYCEKCQD